jgi:signal transduction histidine kinase
MLIEGATVDLEQENQRLRAELRAQTTELRGSRARLVAVGDAERRRLERDLHDGAQSRFAGVALHLRLAQRKAPPDNELAQMLESAIGELYAGIEELRELARGIHPAVLTQRDLEAALESLASRAPLPVDVRAPLDGRLPAAVETAAYFAVSEALANVVKHAGAGLVAVDVRVERGRLAIDVADDGRGGASVGAGSGLSGLADRIGALDGHVAIDSPPGAGTRVHVEIPLSRPAAPSPLRSARSAVPTPCRRFLRGG